MGRNLNAKKSWHPLSRQNLEKMMVQSQKKKEEDRKIKELEKEMMIQKQEREYEQLQGNTRERVDFLYNGQTNVDDNEDYLLGKVKVSEMIQKQQIDDTVELPDLHKLQSKIRHDPLYQMKKSQMERIKKLTPKEKTQFLEKLKNQK